MTTGWAISEGFVAYPDAVTAMESRAAAIAAGEADELIWLLEHPPLYTHGASANDGDLKDASRFPVFESQRGGQFTYHGPGQRVAYVMLDLTKRGRDVKQFVCSLEDWIIQTLGAFNVKGERRKGRVGVWVDRTRPGGQLREDKIAAIGVRLKRWVSYHGISLNVLVAVTLPESALRLEQQASYFGRGGKRGIQIGWRQKWCCGQSFVRPPFFVVFDF